MAKLRVDKIASVEASTENTGSVFFDGNADHLKLANSTDFNYGSSDFSIEVWVYLASTAGGSDNHGIASNYITSGNKRSWLLYLAGATPTFIGSSDGTSGNNVTITSSVDVADETWTHIAVSRTGTTVDLYVNGAKKAGTTSFHSSIYSNTDDPVEIGGYNNGTNTFEGYISNLRICKGHRVYKSNFAVPTRELDVHPGPDDDRTVLLACYDGENIFADKTGRHIIAAYGDRSSTPTPARTDSPVGVTTNNPGLVRDVDNTFGPSFQGGVGYNSQNWLTLPKGTTTDRNRTGGRGLFAGGVSPANSNTIYFINISSSGIAGDFGDLTIRRKQLGGCASSTRGVFAGGSSTGESPAPPFSRSNVIDYVTLASTGNAEDFGDLTDNHDLMFCGLSNNTRGIWGGGETPSSPSGSNVIQYVTIPTLGDAQDFGDLTRATKESSACASPTRGIFFINGVEEINYITIATLGDAQDFGDYDINSLAAGCSDSTRGIVGGGAPGINTIQYITISTLGNAVDFGDLTHARKELAAVSNSIRGVFGGGHSEGNTIDYVTIQTTGNAVDWGDLPSANDPHEQTGCSDSHGGIS